MLVVSRQGKGLVPPWRLLLQDPFRGRRSVIDQIEQWLCSAGDFAETCGAVLCCAVLCCGWLKCGGVSEEEVDVNGCVLSVVKARGPDHTEYRGCNTPPQPRWWPDNLSRSTA